MALIYGEPYNMGSITVPNTLTAAPKSSGFSASSLGAWGQLFGVIGSAYGARIGAKIDKQNLKFQGQMSALNAGYTRETSLLSANYAQAMGAINANSIRYTASVNARIAELGAQSVFAQAEQENTSLTLKAGQLKSSQKTAMAANGIDLGEGNAAEVQASTDLMKEIDMNTLKENAVRSAWGYRTQGASAMAEGIVGASNALISSRTDALNIRIQGDSEARNLSRNSNASYAASNAISPDGVAANTLMSGAMGVADSWYRYSKVR